MLDALIQLGLFTSKTFIIALFIVIILIVFFALLTKGKEKLRAKLHVHHLNKKFDEATEQIFSETLNKKEFKKFLKDKKVSDKAKQKIQPKPGNVYVLNFHGDIKASAVDTLGEEVTAILNIAQPNDKVVVRLESHGGIVHGYGLAAAELMRFRARQIPLIVCIDKIAASGGYMMACVADKILCAPYAIVGSIGVIVQLPNFHRLMKDKHIDFELHHAGEFKRTITLFGENTKAGREKLQHEIEEVHQLFKNLITDHRPHIDIKKVATGEHWLGKQALGLNLVDEIKTSNDYLLECSRHEQVYEICYEVKRPWLAKLTQMGNSQLNNPFFKL